MENKKLKIYDIEKATVKGVEVHRVSNNPDFVAAPNGKRFDMINVSKGEFLFQAKDRKEAFNWLCRNADGMGIKRTKDFS